MTGLIYVVLIAVWGVVLVPRWLRRHDERRGLGNPEALEAALADDWDARYPGRGARSEDDPGVDRAATWGEYLRGLAQVDYRQYTRLFTSPGANSSLAARRRGRILIGLTATVAISLFGTILGILPGSLMVLSTLLFVGYLSAMVLFMRRSADLASLRSSDARFSGLSSARGDARTASSTSVDGVRVVGEGGDAWDPRETTLPTYVSKPKASKIPRRIDLTSGWTGADMVAQAREQQASPALARQFDREWAAVEPDLDVEVEHLAQGQGEVVYRRAVNE